jgi:DNA-binding NarL/FixJ family response regulator
MIETLRLVERFRPRLALVDVALRDKDGIQCARQLKTVSPVTRVVLIRAYPDREFRRLGLETGAVAFLDKKDIDAATVRQMVVDTLGS